MTNDPDLYALLLMMLFMGAAAAWIMRGYYNMNKNAGHSETTKVDFKIIPGNPVWKPPVNDTFYSPEQKAVARALKIITTIAGPGRCLYIRNEAAQIDLGQIYALNETIPDLLKILQTCEFTDDTNSNRFFGFSQDVIVSEALNLFGMIDTEQMSRTIKAVRSLMQKHNDLAKRAGVA